jgi:hypothetical protein
MLSAHPQSDLVPMMLPEMLIASEGAAEASIVLGATAMMAL